MDHANIRGSDRNIRSLSRKDTKPNRVMKPPNVAQAMLKLLKTSVGMTFTARETLARLSLLDSKVDQIGFSHSGNDNTNVAKNAYLRQHAQYARTVVLSCK